MRTLNKLKVVSIAKKKEKAEAPAQLFPFIDPASPGLNASKITEQKTYEQLNKKVIKEKIQNSAREKAKEYAKNVRRPNRSIELAERIQERKVEELENSGHNGANERFMYNPLDIRKVEEEYKRLFNF